MDAESYVVETPDHLVVETLPPSGRSGDGDYSPGSAHRRMSKDSGRCSLTPSVDGDTSLRAGESLESGLSVYDEVQMMRRQLAKLNHRLMAVELENQQQQQREMVRYSEKFLNLVFRVWIFVLPVLTFSLQVLTVVVSAYFVVKALLWLNKSM